MAAIQIGRDYRGTLSNVQFDGVEGTAGDVAWSLYDDAGDLLGTGTGEYVEPGVYEYVIESSVFEDQGPLVGRTHRLGRLHVTLVQDGVNGSWGEVAYFSWPQASAG